MMRRTLFRSVIFVVLPVVGLGCAPRAPEEKILARIGDRYITVGEIENRISKLPPHYQEVVNKNKKKFLDDIVVDELFYEEAIRQGLHKDPETNDVIREAKKKILMARLIKEEVEDKIFVTDDMMREYYEENKEQFKTPELWRASHILVKTEEEAESILEELSKGKLFEDLARERSQDATAARGGDIGYFSRSHLVPEFEEACLQLETGEVSDVVKSRFGYHIIRLTDKKESQTEGFERARRTIHDILKRIKRKELFNNLVNRLKRTYRVELADDVHEVLGQTQEVEESDEAPEGE